MGGIKIGKANIGTVVNIEGDVVLHSDGTPDIPAIVRAVLSAADPATALTRLEELDEIARRIGVPQAQVEEEAARQLEASEPSRPVADAVAGVAQGAAGGVVSQGIFTALRAFFGF